ncbi:MAG: sugar transferase [Gemmatimonadota bacterium]
MSLYPHLKRPLDAAGAALLLVLLSPVLGLTALAVWIALGTPVLFRQMRPGRHGRPFELLKFRTMTPEAGGAGDGRSDAARLTRFGRALRRASLDEWPQLWNVLRGDLSFVGPRPLLMEYLPRYSAEQARRHAVRPGVTGLAQVSGRNALDWPERLRLDVRYVDTLSFGLDVKILLRTILHVVRGTGVSAPGEATVARFQGEQ